MPDGVMQRSDLAGGHAVIRPDDPVGALMSMPIAWVERVMSLTDLAARLAEECVGAVAVMSGDNLEGVVSERDIVRALAAGGDLTEVWAADVMADDPVHVDVDDSILSVAERMLDEGVRHMPVVSDGMVVGVVSARDALRVLADAWRRSPEGEERRAADG